MSKSIPFSSLFNIQQNTNVIAGGSERVFYGKIPDSCVGFMNVVATVAWFSGVTYDIRVDGESFSRIERDITLANPLVYHPKLQIVVKDRIEVFASNSSTATYTLGMLIDGIAFHKESMIGGMGYNLVP